MKKEKFLAIITARGGSKGIKNKNIKTINRKPLIYYPIYSALRSNYISKVIVSTDSKKIADLAKRYGADVPFMRPAKISKDSTSSFEVVKHCIDFINKSKNEFKNFILLEPTSPMTTTYDINLAIKKFLNSKKAEALIGVCQVEGMHPDFLVSINNSGFIKPFNSKNFKTSRRQEISKLYFYNGSLYISAIKSYLNNKTFLHNKTMPYIMSKKHSFEIDDILDLKILRTLLKNNK